MNRERRKREKNRGHLAFWAYTIIGPRSLEGRASVAPPPLEPLELTTFSIAIHVIANHALEQA